MEPFEILPKDIQEKYNVKVEYMILKCQNPNCAWHWGVLVYDRNEKPENRNQFLTEENLICQKCKKAGN